eukprot:TRINITY_DN2203_c0_g1_i1.p1 TRINITY_DN2203_c0_g1~~TRINITY_DN2203_c0_g1_i1.p1  ORF type:complete len:285 (+),score=16.98 TRINITY_DN2203_c0_g1_i1:201-1055(+)
MAVMSPRLVSRIPIVLTLLCFSEVLCVTSDLHDGHKGSRNPSVNKLLLLHGANTGAISWYRIIPALEQKGLQVTAVDSLSLGRDTTPTCNVTSIQIWAKNAVSYVEGLALGEKVIVVGHSAGGLVVQYLCENFPEKIAAAIFVASLAPPYNESASTVFAKLGGPLSGPGFTYTPCDYAVGNSIWRVTCQDCSEEDIKLLELASRPQPLSVFAELTKVTAARFGSVRRFWVKTLRDQTVAPRLQDYFISNMKPVKVIDVDTDHALLISSVRKLTRALLRIVKELA